MKTASKPQGVLLKRGYSLVKGEAAFFYFICRTVLPALAVAGLLCQSVALAVEKSGQGKAVVSEGNVNAPKQPAARPVNPRYRDDGFTPLHDAAFAGLADAAITLINKGADVNAKNVFGQTPLHLAVYSGSLETVRALVKKGSDVNATDNYGHTPLHMTVVNDTSYVQIAVLLLSKGAQLGMKDAQGFTALHYAARTNYPDNGETAAYFIEKGAPINARAKNGNTPLHEAVIADKAAAVQVLIEGGADIDFKNDAGYTPLHVAALAGNPESANLLIESGADVNARNNAGETAMDIAHRVSVNPDTTIRARLGARGVIDLIDDFLNSDDDGSSGLDDPDAENGNGDPDEVFLQP